MKDCPSRFSRRVSFLYFSSPDALKVLTHLSFRGMRLYKRPVQMFHSSNYEVLPKAICIDAAFALIY